MPRAEDTPHTFQDDNSDHQETSFPIILVDLEKAADDQVIQCIERPLTPNPTDDDVAYVALSYRWGELSETIVDTELGYLATITSFDVNDFYQLCRMIRQERDLHSIPYVWVDAICIDQTNHDHRKATIHHMSTIYERATAVLAVPDLHLQHVAMAMAVNWQLIETTRRYSAYLYHLLHGNTQALNDLDNLWLDKIQYDMNYQWQIAERTKHIQDSVDFLTDLVRDWSSRVWVISECQIAKRKHRLKYWFIQLELPSPPESPPPSLAALMDDTDRPYYDFLEFDFDDPSGGSLATLLDDTFISTSNPVFHQSIVAADTIYQQFHTLMIRQLDQQNFLEMMLASKASKNEDRFYAVLPLSHYRHQLSSKDVVDSWNIHNTFSVKLKLFEWMTTEDKLTLLFLSSGQHSVTRTKVLPTFATTKIYWPENFDEYPAFLPLDQGGNFDLTSPATITLSQFMNNKVAHPYRLTLRPMTYYVLKSDKVYYMCQANLARNKTAYRHLQLDEGEFWDHTPPDVVCIPTHHHSYTMTLPTYHDDASTPSSTSTTTTSSSDMANMTHHLFLVGSFVKNKWILEEHFGADSLNSNTDYSYHFCKEEYNGGFNIY